MLIALKLGHLKISFRKMELNLVAKLIIGALILVLVILFILYIPEIFEGIKTFFLNFDLLESFK